MSSNAAYKIVKLASGVHSVHSVAHRETFHPVIGPVAEAEALYVRQLRLPERMAAHSGEFVIWDVGLGAAANVLTVLRATRSASCPLRIISFDHTIEPLQFALANAEILGYFNDYEKPVATFLRDQAQFNSRTPAAQLIGNFTSAIFLRSLSTHSLIHPPSPSRLRTPFCSTPFPRRKIRQCGRRPLFANLFRLLDLARPCALPTYSRSTILRVTLLLAGFFVGAGHATGEKEETTIAANTPELITEPLDAQWLRRARNSTSAEPLWEPVYRQAPLTKETWGKLQQHPQFR